MRLGLFSQAKQSKTISRTAGKNYSQFSVLCTLVFARESSYCFQCILAIAILSVRLSVCLSVCHTGGSVKNGAS